MSTFLTAEWRKLIMANYAIDYNILLPYLPAQTELDLWNQTCYVSLVGFMFENVKMKGITIPFHVNFEEVNLRFYVKYKDGSEWKRGVVFIKEIVPKPALSFVANTVYGEHYETLKMNHEWKQNVNQLHVSYSWLKKGKWNRISVNCKNELVPIEIGSEEEFITEHYWGYTKIDDTKTSEYEVTHPRWDQYPIVDYAIDVDFELTYGKDFGFLNELKPSSVFMAEGSEISVKSGKKI